MSKPEQHKYNVYADVDGDGDREQLQQIPGGKRLTIYQVRKLKKRFRDAISRLDPRLKLKPAPEPKTSVGERALAVARRELGYKESPAGSNRTKYGKWYGMDGNPWCAMFVSWCFDQIGVMFRYAYVPYVVNDFPHIKTPRPGDIVCFDFNGGVADHIGFVEKVYSDGSMDCIEGNTAVGNDANGGMVMRRRRYPSQVECFVRIAA